MNITELRSKLIIKKNLKIGLIFLVVYGLWWLFGPLLGAWWWVNFSTKAAIGGESFIYKDYYYTSIQGLTYINKKFIMFVNKPYLFERNHAYIYSSLDGIHWQEEYKGNINYNRGVSRHSQIIDGSRYDHTMANLPIQFNGKCYAFSGMVLGVMSDNCYSNWKVFTVKEPESFFGSDTETKYSPKGWVGAYLQNPVKYQDKLIKIFDTFNGNIRGGMTNNIVPNSKIVYIAYATTDVKSWHEIKITRPMLYSIIKQNNLQQSWLSIAEQSYPESGEAVDYSLLTFPASNWGGFEVLSNIIFANNLNINLDKAQTTYGNNTYLAVFYRNGRHWLIKSSDGVHYQIYPLATNVEDSIAVKLSKFIDR